MWQHRERLYFPQINYACGQVCACDTGFSGTTITFARVASALVPSWANAMEDEAVRARLEAAAAAATCDDGDAAQQALAVDAITAAIASCLEEDPSSSVVPAIAQFVRESPMSVAIVQQLIYTRTSCDDLLDALLPVVIEMHEAQEGADGRLELLTSFFALALRQVQSPEQSDAGMAMALVWSERVLEVIYTLEVQTALEREVVRQVVTLLVKIESALPPEAEFKVLTLAWKVRQWKWRSL